MPRFFLPPDQDTKAVGTISKGKKSRAVCFDTGPDGEDRWCSVNFQGRIGYVLADKMDWEMSEPEREAAGLGSHQAPESTPKVTEAAPPPRRQSEMQKRTAFKAEQQMIQAINLFATGAVNDSLLQVISYDGGETTEFASLVDLSDAISEGDKVLIRCNISGCVHRNSLSGVYSYQPSAITIRTTSASAADKLASIISNDLQVWHAVQ